jgi:hypothetical protein
MYASNVKFGQNTVTENYYLDHEIRILKPLLTCTEQ